ncbi:MAG: carbohydrate kinase [Nitrosomonas sp. PRO4]|nr:carbohydrate kinase [Nitrosomonas sp. PRO4]
MIATQTETIILFGEVLVDIFADRKVFGGAPFNVARHLQAFGLHPVLITRTGDDELRRQLIAILKETGMDACGIQLDALHPTGQVMVRMEGCEHHFDILPEQAYDYIHAGMAHMVSLAVRPHWIYFGTLAQRHTISAQALASLTRSSKAPRLVDINLRKPWYDRSIIERSLKYADAAKINLEELEILVSLLQLTGKQATQKAAALIKRFALQSLLVTCGEQGAWQLDNKGKKHQVEGWAVLSAYTDSVGAGDGFAAVYMLGQLRNWPIDLTLARANKFAAALCGIRGAIPDSGDFYLPFIAEWKL